MNLIAAVALAALAMLVVAYPLFRKPEEEIAAPSENGTGARWLEDLAVQRDDTYAAIRDLDFDHSIGHVADEDYREMREGLVQQADAILKRIDRARIGKRAVAAPARRAAQVEEGVRRAKGPAQAAARGPRRNCPACNHPNHAADKFCRQCGASLALVCPQCGEAYAEDERFCANCGTRLKGEHGA